MAEIRVNNLGFRYPGADQETLSDLSFNVASGGAHALLGASGAGKTTMLSLLSGLLTATRGEIYFDDRDVTALAPRERNVAQVFQFPVLYDGMNVLRNLTFPLRQRGWGKADAAARASETARALGIDSFLDAPVARLSLFQKQLVSVGRAIVRPDVALVLLDEPLTAVQPSIKWQLRRVLKQVQREQGVTMVYVTHDQTEALTFAEEVSVLAEGRLLQSATGDALYNEPASEFVARFVGSPGMNVFDVEVRDEVVSMGGVAIGRAALADGPARCGCRAEWIQLVEAGPLRADVVRYSHRGTLNGRVSGIAEVALDGVDLSVAYSGDLNKSVNLQIERYVLFRGGERVA